MSIARSITFFRRTAAIAVTALLAACGGPAGGDGAATAAAGKVGHFFIIVLENKNFSQTFGNNSPAPYLAKTLVSQGQFLTHYYGTGHVSLDNYISMVSGQAPNAVTQSDCLGYLDFVGMIPPTATDGQALGQGCVYPAEVKTVADQLEAAGLRWRMYGEDMAASPASAPVSCRHPALNSQDPWQSASAGDQYATRHVPFVYFHSVIDDQARCDQHVVDLSALAVDLQRLDTTANYTFITPDLCSDGHDAPCADGRPGGLQSINAFLEEWVPRILSSPAYQKDGLLLITFDEAEPGTDTESSASCCNEPAGLNTPMPGIYGTGGGRVGAVVLSQFTKPGSVNDTPYNHYSMLRSVEDMFGLSYLGYAGQDGLKAFGADVYNAAP